MPTARLKAGHVQPVWTGHPWVFAQAIDSIEGGAAPGQELAVVDPRGNLLGRGFYSPRSAIAVRILARDATTPIDGAFVRARLERAVALRRDVGLPSALTTGYRLINAEGDGLAGLIVDCFDDVLSVQFSTLGMKQREGMVLDALWEAWRPRAIVDRTPPSAAKAEGFELAAGVLRGSDLGELRFVERGLSFAIPLGIGQKTGFYFDQRGMRARVEELSAGRRVLDAYSFVGAFALAAARGGARSVLAVDESGPALEAGAACARANGLEGRIEWARRDARETLQQARAEGGYDLVVLDPPRLAPTRTSRERALTAYARIAEGGCGATRPGGFMVLCACSASVDLGALTRALAIGALRANAHAVVLERHFQGPDHPVVAAFGEGLYLKALLARIEPR